MISVLFVCLGNICRSPMADGVFQQMVNEAGLSNLIKVDSAGTGGWHRGEPAHQGTRNVLKLHGINYSGSARLFTREDVDSFDYILAMDSSNLSDIGRIAGRSQEAEIRLFLAYANDAGLTDVKDVPDPFYDDKFDEVYELVAIGCRALFDHIRHEHEI